ncbi:hypothetical protein L3Q82_023465 [Scomber scombrus]|uniref:CARD domain-containing protein n=1 Tax=Scomber scombrus TaxID=13677 RepID=A0AAV1QCN9_SCOSC
MDSVCEDDLCWLQLDDFRMLLIKNIEPSRITPYLRQCQVISAEDEEQLFNDPSLVIRRRKVGALLDILQRTGVKGYTAFLESLELDYPQLYSRITGKEPNKTFSILIDTAGESGLTQFLMSELSRLQRMLQNERQRRQQACSAIKDQEACSRQQQLRDREIKKLTERVQKFREERECLSEEVKQLRDHNYSLMADINALSQERSNALLANRDLQIEVERLKLRAESQTRLLRRRTLRPLQESRSLALPMETFFHPNRLEEKQEEKKEEKQEEKEQEEKQEEKKEEEKQEEKKEEEKQEEKQEEKKEEEKKEEEEKQETQQQQKESPAAPQMNLLTTVFRLRRELHRAEEQRARSLEEKEELELRCAHLKGDARMYRQRNKQALRQLEEVMRERDKALESRAEQQEEARLLLQEKDEYREQVRQLTEKSDKLELLLVRSQGEELQLRTRLRRLTCRTHQYERSSEEEATENTTKGSSEEVRSVTSGENEEATLQQPIEREETASTGASWDECLTSRNRPNFCYRSSLSINNSSSNPETVTEPTSSMCDSREVPSGKVYRQLFDAQVQLSRSLLAGLKDRRTDSADNSHTRCSSASRLLCLSSRGQHLDHDEDEEEEDDDVNDVSILPDTVVVDRPSSDIIERLTQKKNKKHKEAVKQLEADLTSLTQVCETQVRTISMDLLSSLQDVDLRLDILKDRMEQLEHVSLQELCGLWEEVEEEVKLKKIRIVELNLKLTECETQRSNKIRALLRTYRHLLEKISSQPPADIHRLIHSEATMLNQCLLANRRSTARLLLLLQEENLQQESLLRLHWEDCLNRWRRSRVSQVVDRFRSVCGTDVEQQLVSERQVVQQLRQTQNQLTEQRCDIISKISLLVPPTCSTSLVCDWFSQLTAVNQQIDSLHSDLLHQLRCRCEQVWQDRLTEVQRCEEVLSALQLSEEEVTDIISSQIFTLIGQSQRQEEERLAALEVWAESVSGDALRVSRCVFAVMRAAALLWETHRRSVQSREEEVQRHLDEVRRSQEQLIQRKKVRLDDLLGGLRQEGSEDNLRISLQRTVQYLQDIKHSCSQCVSEQWEVLDLLPSEFQQELLSYSSSLCSFYQLSSTYTPSPEELQNLHLTSSTLNSRDTEETNPEDMTEKHPISCHNDAQPSQDWLAEAESSLLELYDISAYVTFTSARGVAYTGPAFRCPAPDLPYNLQQETHLNLFPVELLTHTLSRTRTLFLDHLEQRFHDVLSSAVAMVTDRKDAVRLDQELQLQQLDPQNIQTHIYLPRLAELLLHRQCVCDHCELLEEVLLSCRTELQQLQTSLSTKNQELILTLSNMEDTVLTADCSQSVEAVISTLQDCVDHHIKQTQQSQTSFRQTVQVRLDDLRHRTTRLLDSFRLFSEGGDFAPQEVRLFQRRLKEESKQLSVTEENIYIQLEAFQSLSLQQVNEVSGQFEEKLSLLHSELKFTEKIQKIISSTQVHIKAEAASSNQQQSKINNRLEDLKRMMDDEEVSSDQVCSFLSSVSEELRKRCHYLDLSLDSVSLSARSRSRSRREVHSAPPAGLLQPCRSGVDFLDDPAVGVVKTLNRDTLCGGGCPTDMVNVCVYVCVCVCVCVYNVCVCVSMMCICMCVCIMCVYNLCVLGDMLRSLPSALISNFERQQEVELIEEVGGVTEMLEETQSASEEQKALNVRQLRASLSEDERVSLHSRERLRQQQLHSAICCSHLDLQERLRVRGEDFVTSLSALTEKLLHQLDQLITPSGNSWISLSHPQVTAGSADHTLSTTDSPVSVSMATTASITTTRCTLGHLAVIEQRDTAVKRFELLFREELSRSDSNKEKRLRDLQSWSTHWSQQIHTLTHTHSH